MHNALGVNIIEALKKLFHVKFDISQIQFRVECEEAFVIEMLQNEAGLSLFGAADDIEKLHNVGMVERFMDEVLSLDFFGLDGEEDFDSDFSSVFFIIAFEDMSVLAPTKFLSDGIIFDVSV